MELELYWRAVLEQDRDSLRGYFTPDATITWPCTNERFTAEEFVRANCEYPGEWDGKIERCLELGDQLVTAVRVFSKDKTLSFHVVSFFRLEGGKIAALDEYWGDDGPPPQWRTNLHIGKPIHSQNHAAEPV